MNDNYEVPAGAMAVIMVLIAGLFYLGYYGTNLEAENSYLKQNADWNANYRSEYESFAKEKFGCKEEAPNDQKICLFRGVNELLNQK